MAFLEGEDSVDHEEVCEVLHRQVGKVDEVDRCVAVLVAWGLVQWDAVRPLPATTTTVKVLTDKACLHHVNNRHTVKTRHRNPH